MSRFVCKIGIIKTLDVTVTDYSIQNFEVDLLFFKEVSRAHQDCSYLIIKNGGEIHVEKVFQNYFIIEFIFKLIYTCGGKDEFQSSMSHDPSDISLIS